ncbi:MAG: YkoP family protein [Steroidobacteraceae bacterium]
MSLERSVNESPRSPRARRWIFSLDRHLRRHYGIYEYTTHRECLLRAERCRADERIVLSDGTRVEPGDPLLRLHLWNEHMPPMGPHGPSMAWARRIERRLDLSLAELARHLAQGGGRAAVSAVCAQMRLRSAHQTVQLSRILGRFGFETVPYPSGEPSHALRRVGENFMVVLLVLAANPISLRAGVWRRGCVRVAISREALLRRYGERRRWRAAQLAEQRSTGT